METPARTTYLLVDGENIDATLGNNVLGRRPNPEDRPRWERVLAWGARVWDQPVRGLFFLAAKTGELPMPFIQALTAQGYKPIPLSGRPDEKVVDIALQRTMDALVEREADVLLLSHDADFLPQLERLLDDEDRRVGIVSFNEFRAGSLTELADDGLELFDLEYDVKAFNVPLNRLRIIPIDEFDPNDFI